MELQELFSLSTAPLFDMDAPGFDALARLKKIDDDVRKIPGYINAKKVMKYAHADVEEISYHNLGIAVKFYKGDEDETD